MKVYSYITRQAGEITKFNPSMKEDKATLTIWSTDGKDNLLKFSDAVPATFEQVSEYAEDVLGIEAWYNRH